MASPAPEVPAPTPTPTPSPFNYILSFLLVGICWGFTTPFIRKAAVNYTAPSHPSITDPNRSWIARNLSKAFFTVLGLLRSPAYAIPLVLNLTGSIWFFLLIGQAGTFRSLPYAAPLYPFLSAPPHLPQWRQSSLLPFPSQTRWLFCSPSLASGMPKANSSREIPG